MVVGMIGMLMVLVVAHAWVWVGQSVVASRDTVTLVRELKMAADALATDLGASVDYRSTDGQSVELNIDGGAKDGLAQWQSPDTVVRYLIQDGRLVRDDDSSELTLAHYVTTMSVTSSGGDLVVTMTAAFRDAQRQLTLRMRED
jgi:hypothetical protein